ncbi:MAG TPA: ABC transporter ATP-binding protein [Thermodesulfobacteriota bacterium]|nr:ABC transporter ATP-binding protein [Thermodesulfobacteriota bacterium]
MAVLKTENLTRYFGGLAALARVNMEFRENEILGIIGPNGAGKTTFINVIAGIYLPTQGKIFFNDQDISERPAHMRCRLGIGRTFQLVRPLQGLSLLENVMVGSLFGKGLSQREAQTKAKELCEFLGLSDLSRDITRMTALEIKKMEIAHALATQPKLLFLDEVMAGLSSDETMELIDLVKKIHSQGITIGIVEHVMRVIRELTHRVVVLDWGEVIAEGPYEKVSNDPRVIAAYLGEEA